MRTRYFLFVLLVFPVIVLLSTHFSFRCPSAVFTRYDVKLPAKLKNNVAFTPEFHGFELMVATFESPKEIKKPDVSWVLQLSIDRIDPFVALLELWNGPVSAVIATTNFHDDFLVVQPLLPMVDFHFVHIGQDMYPVNALRNCAMNKARTEFIFVADADFIPNQDLYSLLLRDLPLLFAEDTRKVYVLPAFQLFPENGGKSIPKTKEELVPMYKQKAIDQVHPDPGRRAAHMHTDYDAWIAATSPYQVPFQFPYEPYFVAHKSIPRFDPRFIGYGNDKAVQAQDIAAKGYQFMVYPHGFVVHKDHPPSPWSARSYQPFEKRMLRILDASFLDRDRRRSAVRQYTPLPPDSSISTIFGFRGESCDQTCKRHGLDCDIKGHEYVNHCEALEQKVLCLGGCAVNKIDRELPYFNTIDDKCYASDDITNFIFSCSVSHGDYQRLCPCGGTPWQKH